MSPKHQGFGRGGAVDSVRQTAAYLSLSSNIMDVLNDELNKAKSQFDDTRHAEANAENDVAMLKQSLEDLLTTARKQPDQLTR